MAVGTQKETLGKKGKALNTSREAWGTTDASNSRTCLKQVARGIQRRKRKPQHTRHGPPSLSWKMTGRVSRHHMVAMHRVFTPICTGTDI
eukprot:3606160-Pyramimonas_sp.AAC.1